ncbi:MAG: hypothetical protein AB1345_13365 [Chloroflexota bacterium]
MLFIFLLVGGYFAYQRLGASVERTVRLGAWLRNPQQYSGWSVHALERCGEAPFLIPTDGYVGYLWGDAFRLGRKHQGIDIFGGTEAGRVPVYVAHAGYLTRLWDWKSSVIIRIPHDPLYPERQIWMYYTHMADAEGNSLIDPEFPPGTREEFVEAGILLGYQGDYSGDPLHPVGVHLHFSIVLSDEQGYFLNELQFENTADPSLYFGLSLNAQQNLAGAPVCDGERQDEGG